MKIDNLWEGFIKTPFFKDKSEKEKYELLIKDIGYDGLAIRFAEFCVERVAQATRQDFAKEIHDKLDKLNGELGIEQKLCLFCCATSHNAMGIYHNDNCIILSLRKEFESKLGEEKNENTA